MSMNSSISLSIINSIDHHLITICTIWNQKLFQREINASGEPTTQVITNWDATRGTPLGQRGATRDKPPETEV